MRLLKTGERVYIKSLGGIPGEVLGIRAVDVVEEKTIYQVQITRYFRRADLEAEDELVNDAKPQRGSAEWLEEYDRFIDLGQQYRRNLSNQTLLRQCAESGSKLGILGFTEPE
jgi:hypothetical protein